jgi:transcription initiation factor TFIIIB Brf1 subunit/transcription initiation factor TFIIB
MEKVTEWMNKHLDGSVCPICGAKWPTYLIFDESRNPVGCEQCLMILKEGRIQL